MSAESAESADVVILGGGLAGLTLAVQLRGRFPSVDVVVLERARHPVPEAAYKVGESSVEIGAHYFASVLGLRDHLESQQLAKFGFRFFHSDGREDIDRVREIGITRYLPFRTYQIDRGRFENFLGREATRVGARFIDGAVVRGLTVADPQASAGGGESCHRESSRGESCHRESSRGESCHEVLFERDGTERRIRARWLVDASGRAGLLKRKLDLAEPNEHDANGAWFRIAAKIDIDAWSSDAEWLARCNPRERWRSTNHLVGDGYWVWLIPLASGSHSVGIVADARRHPLREMNSFPRALEWLRVHQPRLAAALAPHRDALQDFACLRRFSYGCKRVFSGARWALTGEAGVFLDPFYSPGSDFIAIANTYITELIARDQAGEPVTPYARLYQQYFFSFYRSTLALYLDQYAIFGDPEVLPLKVYWDESYYWGVLCHLFIYGRIADTGMLKCMAGVLASTVELNQAVQQLLRGWSRGRRAKRNSATLVDQSACAWFTELNRRLLDPLDDAGFESRLKENCAVLRGLATELAARAASERPELDSSALRALLEAESARSGPPPRVSLGASAI